MTPPLKPACGQGGQTPYPSPDTNLAVDPPTPCGTGTTPYHWPPDLGNMHDACPELHNTWLCITLFIPCAYRVIRTFSSLAQHMTQAICYVDCLLLVRSLTVANTYLASVTIWFVLKRPARRVVLSGHRQLWLLRATVLLLACQTQSSAASLNVLSPSPMNRSQARHRARPRPPPPFIPMECRFHTLAHPYVHALLGLLAPPQGNQVESPPAMQYCAEYSHYHPPSGLTSKILRPLWDMATHLITVSNDLHPNPRW